jgi:hypothetical protein
MVEEQKGGLEMEPFMASFKVNCSCALLSVLQCIHVVDLILLVVHIERREELCFFQRNFELVP